MVAGGEIDDGRGSGGGDEDNGQAELPAERSAGLAEEHRHPRLAGGASSSEYTWRM